MELETQFTVLLVVTCCLQLGALAMRVTKRSRAAFAMAGTNTALSFAFSLMIFAEFLQSRERMKPWLLVLVVLTLQVAAAVAAVIGLAKRRESGWLFWPVWLWNFVMIYELVRLRFFFLSGWSFG